MKIGRWLKISKRREKNCFMNVVRCYAIAYYFENKINPMANWLVMLCVHLRIVHHWFLRSKMCKYYFVTSFYIKLCDNFFLYTFKTVDEKLFFFTNWRIYCLSTMFCVCVYLYLQVTFLFFRSVALFFVFSYALFDYFILFYLFLILF